MNIFQLLLSQRRQPAVSSAAATMATRISMARLQCLGSLGSLAPHSPDTGTSRTDKESHSSQPGARCWLNANPYGTLTNSSVPSHCYHRGLGLTWCLAAHQRCSLPLESSAWVETEHTKEEVGGRRGKWETKKITRSFTISLAEFE